MISRRAFVASLAGGLLAAPLATGAQQAAMRTPKIVLLDASSMAARVDEWNAFRQGLRELGYIEGQNIAASCTSTCNPLHLYRRSTPCCRSSRSEVYISFVCCAVSWVLF